MIPLVRHAAGNDPQVHFLHSHGAAADILRAFGGDPGFLDTIADADEQPNLPNRTRASPPPKQPHVALPAFRDTGRPVRTSSLEPR
jgi:hypothetical protein